MLQELDSKQELIDKLQRHLEDVVLKSKADIKVLVKEVKLLRGSQEELKEMLNQSTEEKAELQVKCELYLNRYFEFGCDTCA